MMNGKDRNFFRRMPLASQAIAGNISQWPFPHLYISKEPVIRYFYRILTTEELAHRFWLPLALPDRKVKRFGSADAYVHHAVVTDGAETQITSPNVSIGHYLAAGTGKTLRTISAALQQGGVHLARQLWQAYAAKHVVSLYVYDRHTKDNGLDRLAGLSKRMGRKR